MQLIYTEQKQVCLVDGAIFSDFRIWNCIVDCVAANVCGKRWVCLQSGGKRVVAAAAGELCCSRSNERLPQREYHTLLFEMSRETFKSKDMCLSRPLSGGKRVVAAAVVL